MYGDIVLLSVRMELESNLRVVRALSRGWLGHGLALPVSPHDHAIMHAMVRMVHVRELYVRLQCVFVCSYVVIGCQVSLWHPGGGLTPDCAHSTV